MHLLKNRVLVVCALLLSVIINNAFAEPKSELKSETVLSEAAELANSYTAKQVVHAFQLDLLNIMKQGQDLGFQGRYAQLKPAVLKSHDLTKIVRIVVGKEWKQLSNQQRQTLSDVFTQLSISAYAQNFKAFSGESFVYLSEDETARGGIIVHTSLVLPKNKDVKLDYMLKKKGGGWRIINIIANGVSDLALKRSEYTSILKRKGFEALIAKISEKIDNYAKQ